MFIARMSLMVGMVVSTFILLETPLPCEAGVWKVTCTSSNSTIVVPTSSTPYMATSLSRTTSLVVAISASGITASPLSGQTTAWYSGTWTFQWMPNNGNDWPTSYRIRNLKSRIYQTAIKDGSGTAKVYLTGGADKSVATAPTTPPDSLSISQPVITTDSSIPNLTVKTTVADKYVSKGISGGWATTRTSTTLVIREYTAAYFTANFSMPSSVILTFTCESQDITASINYNSSSNSGSVVANAMAMETFSGENI